MTSDTPPPNGPMPMSIMAGTDDEAKLAPDLMGEDGFEGVAFGDAGIVDAEGLSLHFEGESERLQP